MGLFDEIEKQAEEAVKQQGGLGNLANEAENLVNQEGGVEKLADEAENATGGRNSGLGNLIEEGKDALKFGGDRPQR